MVRGILQRLLGLLLALIPLAEAGAQGEAPSVRMVWTTTPPVIDGVIDEGVWEDAARLGPLTQTLPRLGAEPSQRTEVRILTDQHNLYVAIRCFDDEPEKILARYMRRDAFPFAEDQIVLIFDTFHDRRNGYAFNITASGGRSDVLIQNPDVLLEWDTIWSAKTTLDDEGWSAEAVIPYQSINFDPEGDVWGFNFGRFIARNEEAVRWADITNDRNVSQLGQAGTLTGLRGIQQGLGLDVTPSFTLKREDNDDGRHRTTGDPSLDIFYKLTPGLTAAVTANTDFSETEVDDRQVDLSRFDLFFPERRAFFLQDALIFDFAGLKEENGQPFFSRRIGRENSLEGDPIDIRAGAKLTGREGPLTLGLLGVNQSGNAGVDSKSLFVGRASLNVFEESKIGLIATHGDPSSNRENSLVGADFQYRNSNFGEGRTLTGTAWFQHSFSSNTDGNQEAFGGKLEYPNDLVNWNLGFQQFGKNFKPGVGFSNRTDIRRYEGEYRYRIRPEDSFLRTIDSKIEGSLVTNVGHKVESGLLSVTPVKLSRGGTLDSGDDRDAIELKYEHSFERIREEEPFEIHPNICIPTGSYHFDEGTVRAETSRKRLIGADAEIGAGTFYNGHRIRGLGEIDFRPNKHVLLSFRYEHHQVWLPRSRVCPNAAATEMRQKQDFKNQLAKLILNLQFTPNISWETTAQWDNVSDKLDYNSRFRWIIQDGREFHVIFNQDFDTRDEIRSRKTEGILKLEWTFRF